MSFLFRLIVSCVAIGILAPSVLAEPPSPGEYVTEGAWGTLSIKSNSFKIFTVGANAHYCELSGRIKGAKGFTEPEKGASDAQEEECIIMFKPIANGFDVSSDTEMCRQFCGMRAGFTGKYYLPPPGCAPKEHIVERNRFKEKYDAKEYQQAYDNLNSFYNQCSKFLTWVEIDKVRNDLAISQYHLGHNDACLNILKDTLGAKRPSEEELLLPPADNEAYLPVAKATWFNLKKCGQQGK